VLYEHPGSRGRRSRRALPRIVRFVDALPKDPSGKILKRSIDRTALARDTSAADAAARRPWASAGS
jgi:acyl-coenzyme A synthetase/AMP-(fatty) acid ligase